MKYFKICKVAMVAILSVSMLSCYDDKGGNDFDTTLPDVEIVIPKDAYSGSLGSTISINPIVKTDIDKSDLQYFWEVKGELRNSQQVSCFKSLVTDEQQGESLNYVCKLDSNVTSVNKSYDCRLRVHQKSTGRDFYSSNIFTITIEGISGLMVLYGDDNNCDVGMLCADEFMPQSSSTPEKPIASKGIFSTANNGKKLSGKGLEVYQGISTGLSYVQDKVKERMRILVRTDKETYWLNRADMSIYGDWNEVFYLKGDRRVNDGNPKGFIYDGIYAVAFDGDDVFMAEFTATPSYLFPVFTPDVDFQGNHLKFAPQLCNVSLATSGNIQRVMYADAVNGDVAHNGFVGINNSNVQNIKSSTFLLDTKGDNVKFNPGDMKAELISMSCDSRAHVIAVLKGKADNSNFAGKYFLADLNAVADKSGESTFANVPVCLCDLSTQTDIDKSIKFAFGSTINMYYYATPETVYRYGLDGTHIVPATPLVMADGSALGITGEITMMKMLGQQNVTLHTNDEVLLVATYDGSSSALYALHLDTMTGNVKYKVKYDSSNVENWAFGKIYDVNVKSL